MMRSYTTQDGTILELDTAEPLTPEQVKRMAAKLTEGLPDIPDEDDD